MAIASVPASNTAGRFFVDVRAVRPCLLRGTIHKDQSNYATLTGTHLILYTYLPAYRDDCFRVESSSS
jgi:hypothetical protein